MSRRRLTKAQKADLMAAYGHACGVCGVMFEEGPRIEFDHALPLALGGADEPGNMRPICVPCHKSKSALDIRKVRKADRCRTFMATGKGRKRRGRKLEGRGFDKRFTKKLRTGEVVRRDD